MSRPPEGEPAPPDGTLPGPAREQLGRRPFGVYVHVPFCTARCGYCDFNTYTASELGGGVSPASYRPLVEAELALARRVLDGFPGPVGTVFFGGGTPSLLPADDIVALLDALGASFGLAGDVEVSVEANPESLDRAYLDRLVAGGVTRLSLGMQSASPRVLAALDRVHTPGRVVEAVADARAAGIGQLSLDLIYGAPGETAAEWRGSLDAALSAAPDHVSAYALTVEPGTRLAARIGRGELAGPDDDVLADRYLLAEEVLSAAGLRWYEVSNWAGSRDARCRHNLGYWSGADWWGFGPGAHSHVGGVRWWNVRHPSAYAELARAGRSPAAAREILDPGARQLERVMLGLRIVEGLPLGELSATGRRGAIRAAADGLLDPVALADGRAVLTVRGRLLADAVVRDLTD